MNQQIEVRILSPKPFRLQMSECVLRIYQKISLHNIRSYPVSNPHSAICNLKSKRTRSPNGEALVLETSRCEFESRRVYQLAMKANAKRSGTQPLELDLAGSSPVVLAIFNLAYVEQRTKSATNPVPGNSRGTLHTPDGEPDAIGSPIYRRYSQAAKGGGLQNRQTPVRIRIPAPKFCGP